LIDEQREKADQNRFRSRAASIILVTSTGAIPVLLVVSTKYLDFWLGKVVPAILAALAAATGTVMVMVKPQERWRLHRSYQRKLESESLKYQHRLDPYDVENRDTKLLEKLIRVREEVLAEWVDLMPTSDSLTKLMAGPEVNQK